MNRGFAFHRETRPYPEAAPGLRAKLNVGYPAGAAAYFTYLDGWRSSGEFEGLMFR